MCCVCNCEGGSRLKRPNTYLKHMEWEGPTRTDDKVLPMLDKISPSGFP